ncbi:MAG TPA: hypothetical protein VF832_13480 [Longimicrobiales bacterium]
MRRDPDELARRVVRLLPGVGPAVVRAARALGMFARTSPEPSHWTAGDPIEQVRALARDEEDRLLAAAIALTLSLHDESLLAEEPRTLTLRNGPRSASNWWQSRLSPSSLPPRRVGPQARTDVFQIPMPESEPGPGRTE